MTYTFKKILGRLICRHTYKQVCMFSGNHIETGKAVVFNYDFECTKCGKRIHIVMDELPQIEN